MTDPLTPEVRARLEEGIAELVDEAICEHRTVWGEAEVREIRASADRAARKIMMIWGASHDALGARIGEATQVVRDLLEAWPEGSVPNGPLCVRAANVVNALSPSPTTPQEEKTNTLEGRTFDDLGYAVGVVGGAAVSPSTPQGERGEDAEVRQRWREHEYAPTLPVDVAGLVEEAKASLSTDVRAHQTDQEYLIARLAAALEAAARRPGEEEIVTALGRPRRYDYRYLGPMGGETVWRAESGVWNGQQPSGSVALYDAEQVRRAILALFGDGK